MLRVEAIFIASRENYLRNVIFKSTCYVLNKTHTEFEINLTVVIKETKGQIRKSNSSVNTNFITLAGIILWTD